KNMGFFVFYMFLNFRIVMSCGKCRKKNAVNNGENVYLLNRQQCSKIRGSRELNEVTITQLRYTFSHSSTKSKFIAVNNQTTATAINHEKIEFFSEIDFPILTQYEFDIRLLKL